MRIHGIHSQGLRPVGPDQYLALDAGYQLLIAAGLEEAHGLICLFDALLYPAADLGEFAVWRRHADQPAKAGLGLSLGDQAYRVAVDLDRAASVLGRFDEAAGRYERVAAAAGEIQDELIRNGFPAKEDFQTLFVLDGSFAAEGSTETTITRTPLTLPDTPEAVVDVEEAERRRDAERARAQTRLRLLESARTRFEQLRAEESKLCQAADKHSDIAQLDADVEERIEEFRERGVLRQTELNAVDALRRGFLKERGQLRGVPAKQAAGSWLGLALGVVGGLAGALVQPAFYALALVGMLAALVGFGVSRNARRKLVRIEAQLATLRSREASIERRFEADTAPVRSALRVLELDSLEELPHRVSEFRQQTGQLEAVRRDLEEARAAYPETAAAEIDELVRRLREGDFAVEGEETSDGEITQTDLSPIEAPHAPDSNSSEPASGADILESLLAAAERLSNFDRLGIEERLTETAPTYIRAFTGNAFAGMRRDGGEWFLLRKENADAQPLAEIGPDDVAKIGTALQLALVEALAAEQRLPLLVGPQFDAEPPEFQTTLARALRRLASGVQVLQCSSNAEPWSEFASVARRLED